MIRLAVLCSLLLAVPTVGRAQTPDVAAMTPITRTMHIRLAKDVATIPITRVKGAILVPARIAGKQVKLLFDNGSDASVIDTSLARDNGMELAESKIGLRTGLSVIPTKLTRASLMVGDAVTIEGQFLAADLGPMSQALGTPVAGVLGAEALKAFIVVVNPSKGWIAMGLPGHVEIKAFMKTDTKALDAQAAKAFLPKLAPRSVPFGPGFAVKATINGKPVNLKIDYGSTGTVVLRDELWQQMFPAASRTGKTTSSTRADGLNIGGEIGTGDFEIAGMMVPNMPIASRAGSDRIKDDGLLGVAILGATTTVLDMPKQRLVLFPPNLDVSVSASGAKPKPAAGTAAPEE
jgi:predicted aspartyl protease